MFGHKSEAAEGLTYRLGGLEILLLVENAVYVAARVC